MIGQRLGDWRVLARIGHGGMGTVYLAEDLSGQRVAVKVLQGRVDGREPGAQRFAQELEILRRIDHPRIVGALSNVETAEIGGEPRHYFVMDYVRGRNLQQVIEELGRLEPARALDAVADALEGLGAAHEAGVLHRDVKSANLLISGDGRAKLCDFGLARAVDQTRMTMSGMVLGTPAYLAPEQAKGEAARVETDVYAMGVVLYEALTGTLPFHAETPLALLRMHMDDPPEPPSARCPALPVQVDGLVLRALAKDPAARFASAQHMLDALRGVRAALPVAGSEAAALPGFQSAVDRMIETQATELEEAVASSKNRLRGRSLLGIATVAALVGGLAWLLPSEPPVDPTVPSVGEPNPAPAAAPAEPAPVASAAPASLRAVTLHLAGGAEEAGHLVSISEGIVRLRQADGTERVLPRQDVRRIVFEAE